MFDNRNIVRKQFGQHAEAYRLSRTQPAKLANQATLDGIIKLIQPEARNKAADVGCGGGYMAVSLAKWVSELIAIDITPQMLTQTNIFAGQRGLSNIVRCLADAQNLPFAPEAFDIVSCRGVLHHVPDVAKAVSEMGRILQKGGKLFISDMVFGLEDTMHANRYIDEIERIRDPSHMRSYSLKEWYRFFETAGCKITHMNVTSQKSYKLKKWFDQMGTPQDKVETIMKMLQNIPEDVDKYLKVEIANGVCYISADALGAKFLGIKT